jgi:hypothetical protein
MRFLQVARLTACLAALVVALPVSAQQFATPRPSPGAKVTQTVGTTDLTVAYSRPGVKARPIWGALVPYGAPWRTGANEATQFTCTDDIMVEGQKLAAGTYAFVTIPTADTWTVAFSTQKEMWGAFAYDPKNDALRVTVKPVPAEHVERMQFTIDDPTNDAVTLNLRWEKLSVPVKITVDTNGKTLAAARAAIAAAKPDDWRTPYRAANWAFDNGVAPDDVTVWAQAAANVKDNFQTSGLLARIAAKGGDTKNAVVLMKKSIAFGKADTTVAKEQVENYEKLLAEWSAASPAPAKGAKKK